MNLVLPFTVEIRAKASSSWTMRHVEDRLTYLKSLEPNDQVDSEIRYLQKIKLRKR